MSNKDLSIIIPSYNEKNNLRFLLEKSNKILQRFKKIEIIIVDNGSTDGSKDYLNSQKRKFPKVKILRVKKNIGYGYGIKCGLKKSKGNIVSWTHADLQFDLNDVVKFFHKNCNKIKSRKIIIKGLRQNRSFVDIFFTKSMAIIVNLLFRTKVYDINAQPKMFKKELIKNIFKFGPNNFSIDLFLLLLSSKNGFKIKEFPLKVKKRTKDKAKGGGTLMGKIKLTFSTLKYIFFLRLDNNKGLWKL